MNNGFQTWKLLSAELFVCVFSLLSLSSCSRPILPLQSRVLQKISVSCQQNLFPKDMYIPCVATGFYSNGNQQDITQSVSWQGAGSIVDIGVGTNPGWVRGLTAGTAQLVATVGQIQGTLSVTVSNATVTACDVTPAVNSYPVGVSTQFSSVCVFSDGSYMDVTTAASWSSSSPGSATVVSSLSNIGSVTAVSEGSSTITATFDSVSGTSLVTVLPKQLLTIQVGPQTATIVQGLSLSFTATGIYSDLSTTDLTAITTWSLTNGTVASISNTAGSIGQLTALQTGTTTVVANFGGLSNSALVTVTNPVLNSITVTPASPTVVKGLTQSMTATGHYSDGSTVNITNFVTWASTNSTVASVSNTVGTQGVVTAASVGTANVSANLGAITGLTTVTVSAAQLLSIVVTPTVSIVSLSQTEQLTATGLYTDASTANLTTTVIWSTSNGAIASVSNTPGTQGLTTALGAGTSIISATIGSIAGLANLSVTPATLTSITVTPASPTISGLGSKQMTATGNYSDGSTSNLTNSVIWTTSNGAIVTVSNVAGSAGKATGVSAGSANVIATFGVVSGQTTVTVIPAVLVSITVTPNNSDLVLLQTLQFTATGNYADGTTINLTTSVTWTSSDILTATISNVAGTKGLATGLALGSTTITATFGATSGATILTGILL